MSIHDRFGDRADDYARTRPTYPEALFDHLERLAPAHDLAWDCGAGSGQTALSLARRFSRVIATDSSVRQLARATPRDRISFVAAIAEAAPLRDRCADLITVSAAVHWFDRSRFYAEVRRVARPGAVLAVWSYYQTRIEPAIDVVLERFADEVVGPFWDADLCQYMRTWSASVAWERARGTDPVDVVRKDLARAWGDPNAERAIRWPLHGAIGRVE
jgi:SAM-dependent methyltransferase